MKKITLLLIMLPSSLMVSLLAASMLQIHTAYPQYSESIVTMVLTIPNLTVMLGLILAPILLKKYPIKYLVIAGLLIFIVCNVLPAWCDNFYLLLFLRALGGVGCGLILPLQATFLATYPEKERASLMGLGATVSCLAAAVLAVVSGILAAINWRYVFYLYLINVIGLFLAVRYLPKYLEQADPAAQEEQVYIEEAAPEFSQYRHVLFGYYFLLVGGYLFFSILSAEIAPYLEYVQLGGSAESGLITSISLVGSTISGLVLGQYTHRLKEFSMAGLFLFASIGFALLWIAPSLCVVTVAAFLIGFVSALGSCVVNYEMSRALPLELFTTAAAGISFFTLVLQFISPMLFLGILGLIPSGSHRIVFLIYAVIQLFFVVAAYVLQKGVLKSE